MDESAQIKKVETPDAKEKKVSSLIRFLHLRRNLRIPVLISLIVLLGMALTGLGYICWIKWLPPVWKWGFEPATWRGILSVLGAFYLVIIPFVPIFYSTGIIGSIFDLYVQDQENEVRHKFAQFAGPQGGIEDELEAKDKSGLMPLIRYSRLQLEAYYSIGLSQTQRSFRYSIIAMWIGFFVIVAGIVLKIVPATESVTGDLHIITMASGALIEMISALFLWVYRSSMNQLNYFYNRQMILHSILLCDRLSDSMKEPDEMKKLIIQSVLKHTWEPAYQSLPLISKGKKLPDAGA